MKGMTMTTSDLIGLLQARLREWQGKKQSSRSDLSKMFTGGYVKCLEDVLKEIQAQQNPPSS